MFTFQEYVQRLHENLESLISNPSSSEKIFRSKNDYYISTQPINPQDQELGDVFRFTQNPKIIKSYKKFQDDFTKNFNIVSRSPLRDRTLFKVIAKDPQTRSEIMHAFKGRDASNQAAPNSVSKECSQILAKQISNFVIQKQSENSTTPIQIWYPQSGSDFNKEVANTLKNTLKDVLVQELPKRDITSIGAKNLFRADVHTPVNRKFALFYEDLIDAYFKHQKWSANIPSGTVLSREKLSTSLIKFYKDYIKTGKISINVPEGIPDLEVMFKDRYIKNKLITFMEKCQTLFNTPNNVITEGICIFYDDNISGGFTEANARHALSIPDKMSSKLSFFTYYGVVVYG